MLDKASYASFSPIAALATPPGQSALAIIRISGEGSLTLLARCFSRPNALLNAPGNTVVYGWIIDNSNAAEAPERIDETLVSVYHAPKSCTGEESADICCHGGFATTRAILRLLLQNGFREALRGEFSYRAFINNKIDLSRAEAVMEVVGAKTEKALANSVRRLSGVMEAEITAIKNALLTVTSEIELNLDYSEIDGIGLDSEIAANLPAKDIAISALHRLDSLLLTYKSETLEREGATVVLAGPPNAGKSSLFNLLLKEERAIVSAIPGTTRDWIESWIQIDGIPLRLIDTAGLHETKNPVEKQGIARSEHLIQSADVVLYLIDTENTAKEKPNYPALPAGQTLVLWNKCDKKPMPHGFHFCGLPCLEISAATGAGLPALCTAITGCLKQRKAETEAAQTAYSLVSGQPCPGTARQRALITLSRNALNDALQAAEAGLPLDIIAPYLREALDALGEITGEVTTADILETIFSRFCVGK